MLIIGCLYFSQNSFGTPVQDGTNITEKPKNHVGFPEITPIKPRVEASEERQFLLWHQ